MAEKKLKVDLIPAIKKLEVISKELRIIGGDAPFPPPPW